QRGGDIEITVGVKGQALRTSETLIEGAHGSVGIDFEDTIIRAGYEKISLRTEGEVVGRKADLEGGEDKDLLIASDLEDGAIAISNVETLLAVEGDAGGHAHAFGVGGSGAVGSHAINSTVEAGGNIHLPLAIEGDRCRVHHFIDERL